MTIRNPRLGRASTGAALAVLCAVALAACATDMDMASPPPSGGPTVAPSGPTHIPTDPHATPDGSAPTQTETEWGRIWDGLPDAFPEYPGATPTETGAGPASAILDVGAEEPAAVVAFFESELDRAGLSTGSSDGPREDGSFELEASGAFVHECRVRVTATPMGGTTIVEVMYGAACPFE